MLRAAISTTTSIDFTRPFLLEVHEVPEGSFPLCCGELRDMDGFDDTEIMDLIKFRKEQRYHQHRFLRPARMLYCLVLAIWRKMAAVAVHQRVG